MAAEERVLEVSGQDVNKAIEDGLSQLGLGRDDVNIEILDEGSSGFLGIGGRDARIRLTVKMPESVAIETGEGELAPTEQDIAPEKVMPITDAPEGILDKEIESEIPGEALPADERSEEDVALEIVSTLLDKMQIEATTSLSQTEPDDLTGERRWIVNIHGQDMGILIGPRGDTLNSLQYLARLIAGHSMRHRPLFIVDIEGYRARREQALAKLAERMATKAVQRGRPVSLEPMPPNERRIIHLTLRSNDQVYTESSGEGRRRKVRIYPMD